MSDTNYAVIYDLHSHTTASDGCLTPEALVHRAVDKPGSACNSRAKAKRHAFTLTPSNGAKPFAVWHDSARKRVNSGW
ncbi:hypothetical protein DM483_28755 [Pseudomonas sp. SMT-1]|nr:hypothetical protein DM483_28755 [Pseudomonas sp. SMT-1]